MSTVTSFTYSYNNIDNVEVNKSFEYKTVYTDKNENIWSSIYKNSTTNDNMIESFNKTYKSNMDEFKEQIGNSNNKSNWTIKDFDNCIKSKDYTESYDKYPYYNYYLENTLHNINNHNSSIIPQITNI